MTQTETTTRLPVIALGASLTVLGVIRALGRCGIRTFCVKPQPPHVRRSRWYNFLPGTTEPTPADLPGFLRSINIERAVLIPCADHWIPAVSGLPSELKQRFPSSVPPVQTLVSLLDKGEFLRLTERCDVARPFTLIAKSAADLEDLPEERFVNAFLKPRDSQAFGKKYKMKALRVDSKQHAIEKLREFSSAGFEMLLQEYIPAPPKGHFFIDGFVDRHGLIKALFSRRRVRMFPLDFGNSSFLQSQSLKEVPSAVESMRRLIAAVPYRGIFDTEFVEDPRDGVCRIVEVNARIWQSNQLATAAGFNAPHMAYLDALEKEVPELRSYLTGVNYAHPDFDGPACRALCAEGKMTRWQWARDWLFAVHAVFTWDDPWPATVAFMKRFGARLSRLFGK